MRKLTNFAGGRGYYVNDVEALQEQLDFLRNDLLRKIGACVLAGTEASGGVISGGLVYLGGDIIFHTGFTPSSFPCWMRRAAGNQALETRFFDLSATNNTDFETPVVEIVYAQPGSGDWIHFANSNSKGKTLAGAIADRVFERSLIYAGDWTNITLQNGWTGTLVQYHLDKQGYLRLRGRLNGSSATSAVFATLPQGTFNGSFYSGPVDLDTIHPLDISVPYDAGATYAHGILRINSSRQLALYKSDKTALDVSQIHLPQHPIAWRYAFGNNPNT